MGQVGRALVTVALVGLVEGAACAETPLIEREALFGNPDRAQVQLSPDGAYLSFLAPVKNVMNVWVGPADDPNAAQPITQDRDRGIRKYLWAYTNRHVLYIQDKQGDENWRVYCVNVQSRDVQDLTPLRGVQAVLQHVSPKHPEEVLIALNDQQPQFHNVYRFNILTGERCDLIINDGRYADFFCDDDYRPRFAQRVLPDGGVEITQRCGADWKPFATIAPADALTTEPIGFDAAGEVLYLHDSRERNTAALVAVTPDGKRKTLLEDTRADVGAVLQHPTRRTPQAAAITYERRAWHVLDADVAADFEYLATVADGELNVPSRTLDDRTWIVSYDVDAGPVRYYRYDRGARQATFLFTNSSRLENQPLVKMHPAILTARDGLTLVNYLTLPPGAAPDLARPRQPVPLVLLVHGGPWARVAWGYNPYHQWLANRGYAVLAVNFRGSTGFGKQFINAGDREWGGKMHDDLVDAVSWAVAEKIADPQKVAIFGGSYGGYATLAGLTFTPDLFACGVDIVGPSSLVTLIESIPPYWKPILDMFTTRVGDPRTEEGRKFLLERSPLTHAGRIRRPLLIGQGANDPRVKQAEADQIVKAMQGKDIPVTYVLFPDEGHGFARPENNLAFHAIAEAFLATHLGGRLEPIGDDFRGSSVKVPVGAEQVPGVTAALK